MAKKNTPKTKNNQKLKQATDLLKYALTIDDAEILNSCVEAVIEILEEELNK